MNSLYEWYSRNNKIKSYPQTFWTALVIGFMFEKIALLTFALYDYMHEGFLLDLFNYIFLLFKHRFERVNFT